MGNDEKEEKIVILIGGESIPEHLKKEREKEIIKESLEVFKESQIIPRGNRKVRLRIECKDKNGEVIHLPKEAEERRMKELPEYLRNEIEAARARLREKKDELKGVRQYVIWILMLTGQYLYISEIVKILKEETGKNFKKGTIWYNLNKIFQSNINKLLASSSEAKVQVGINSPQVSLMDFEDALLLANSKDDKTYEKVMQKYFEKIKEVEAKKPDVVELSDEVFLEIMENQEKIKNSLKKTDKIRRIVIGVVMCADKAMTAEEIWKEVILVRPGTSLKSVWKELSNFVESPFKCFLTTSEEKPYRHGLKDPRVALISIEDVCRITSRQADIDVVVWKTPNLTADCKDVLIAYERNEQKKSKSGEGVQKNTQTEEDYEIIFDKEVIEARMLDAEEYAPIGNKVSAKESLKTDNENKAIDELTAALNKAFKAARKIKGCKLEFEISSET